MLLAAVRSLRFDADCSAELSRIPAVKWPELLALTDAAHISLALAARCAELDDRLSRNSQRHRNILAAHREIAAAMAAHGVEFLVLKGLTHAGYWNDAPHHRPQYDVDLYVPEEFTDAALAAMGSLGYQACEGESKGSDHLPVMVRRTGWRWRRDYYDPEQPLALEIHFRFCNPTLGFEAHGAERFWDRRCVVDCDGISLPALHPVDRLRYAAWHAVRHLLRGSLRILHVYELARFLHHSSLDDAFWQEWCEEGTAEHRVAELIAFRLAKEWFGCEMHPIVQDYVNTLPADINRWFELFAFSPITGVTRPNKDEVFLQLCLADKGAAQRRLMPRRMPGFILDALDREESLLLRVRRGASRAQFIASRAVHHARTLPPLVGSGLRWWWRKLPQ